MDPKNDFVTYTNLAIKFTAFGIEFMNTTKAANTALQSIALIAFAIDLSKPSNFKATNLAITSIIDFKASRCSYINPGLKFSFILLKGIPIPSSNASPKGLRIIKALFIPCINISTTDITSFMASFTASALSPYNCKDLAPASMLFNIPVISVPTGSIS